MQKRSEAMTAIPTPARMHLRLRDSHNTDYPDFPLHAQNSQTPNKASSRTIPCKSRSVSDQLPATMRNGHREKGVREVSFSFWFLNSNDTEMGNRIRRVEND